MAKCRRCRGQGNVGKATRAYGARERFLVFNVCGTDHQSWSSARLVSYTEQLLQSGEATEGMRRWTSTGFPNHQYLHDFCLSNDLSLFLFDPHSVISFLTCYLFWLPFDSMLSWNCSQRCSLPLTRDGLMAFSFVFLCMWQASSRTLAPHPDDLYCQLLLASSMDVFRAKKIV